MWYLINFLLFVALWSSTCSTVAVGRNDIPRILFSIINEYRNIEQEEIYKGPIDKEYDDRAKRLKNLMLKHHQGNIEANKPEDRKLKMKINKIVRDNKLLQRQTVTTTDPRLFQKDIKYTYEQMKKMENYLNSNRKKRQIDRRVPLWDQGKVYYEFDKTIKESKRWIYYKAMEYISQNTCIDFEESSTPNNNNNSILFLRGKECFSLIGSVKPRQELSIATKCEKFGVIIHELMHALGIHHTMSRSDRDDYIFLKEEGQSREIKEFTKETTVDIIPYEYASVMHYQHLTGTRVTLYPKQSSYLTTMGSLIPTFYDIYTVNYLYSCDTICTNFDVQCNNGGYLHPRDCSKCLCPRGYGGVECEKPDNGTIVLKATTKWKTYQYSAIDNIRKTVGYVQRDKSDLIASDGSIWIDAPKYTNIEVKFTKMSNYLCNFGCELNGIQVQHSRDPKLANEIYCCPHLYPNYIKSKMTPTIINYHGVGIESFSFEYRYVD